MWPYDVHSSDSLARLWPSPPDLPVNFLTPKLLTRWVWVLLWHWWINGEWFLLWLCCSVCFWDSLAMWPWWQRTYTLGLRFAWFQACTKPPCPALKWLKTPKRLALHFHILSKPYPTTVVAQIFRKPPLTTLLIFYFILHIWMFCLYICVPRVRPWFVSDTNFEFAQSKMKFL